LQKLFDEELFSSSLSLKLGVLFFRKDMNVTTSCAFALKFHNAVCFGEKCVICSLAAIFAWPEFVTTLADDD